MPRAYRSPARAPCRVALSPIRKILRSHNGLLKVELTVHDSKQSDGSTRYCYTDANGKQSPTLRVNPGDLVILTLKNDLRDFHAAGAAS